MSQPVRSRRKIKCASRLDVYLIKLKNTQPKVNKSDFIKDPGFRGENLQPNRMFDAKWEGPQFFNSITEDYSRFISVKPIKDHTDTWGGAKVW